MLPVGGGGVQRRRPPCEDVRRTIRGAREVEELARNVELKVRCDEGTLAAIERELVERGHSAVDLRQVDTYFRATSGRLKLREIASIDGDGDAAELIVYGRPDQAGARLSDYRRVTIPPSEATRLREALRSALGELVVVEKRRRVAVVGRTRVHLDRVAGLGAFVELETVLAEGDDEAAAAAELAEVAASLGIGGLAPIAGSYSDLLVNRDSTRVGDADR